MWLVQTQLANEDVTFCINIKHIIHAFHAFTVCLVKGLNVTCDIGTRACDETATSTSLKAGSVTDTIIVAMALMSLIAHAF